MVSHLPTLTSFAYLTKNAAGQRLIDQAMLNATIVLVIFSSLIGLILTERAARQIKSEPLPAQAPLATGLQAVSESAIDAKPSIDGSASML